MLDTGLDNELLTSDTGLERTVMAAEEQVEQYIPVGFFLDGAGNFVNEDGERVYYWVAPSELGDVITYNPERALYQDAGGYYTEAEIRAAWNADEGMGYLKEQTSWENYWGYLTERQGLIQDGTLFDATGATKAGRDARQDVIQEGGGLKEMGGAKGANQGGQEIIWEGYSGYYQDFLAQPEQMALMSKYGISPIIQNQDGDVFGWNGSSYTKVIKVDDHNYGAIVGELIKTFVISAMTAGIGAEIVGALTKAGGMVGSVASTVDGWLQSQGIYNTTTSAAGAGGSLSTAGLPDAIQQAGAVNAAMSSDVIVNLGAVINGAIAGYDALGVTDNGDQGPYTEAGDGTTRYYPAGLPPGYVYNAVKEAVIHTESGTEYPVTRYSNVPGLAPYSWYVDIPALDDDSEAGGSGATAGDDASNSTTPTTDTSSDTSGSSGGSPNTGGNNPNTTVISNETYGDVEIVTNPDVWSGGNTVGGWEIISNTGVWGQSGISVIRNVASGMYQEIDWDNGTYNQEMQNNPNDNPFDTSGSNQGEGQGDDTESTAGGPATETPPAETPPAEETVDYPDNGSACWLSDGTIGAKKNGQCVPTSDPFNDIIGWPYVLPTEPYNPETPSTDSTNPSADPNADSSSSSATTSGGSTDNNGGTDENGTAGESGSDTGGENGTGENGNNGPGDEGNGPGNGGNGNGPSNPNQFIDGGGGISKATWSPLFRGTKFVPRRKGGGGMMSAMQSPNFATQDYTQQRQGLLSQAWKDLA